MAGMAVGLLAATVGPAPAGSSPVVPIIPSANAVLRDSAGVEQGRASFTADAGGGVRVQVRVSGLTEGWHGFHVHTKGDCAVGDPANPFTAAGGHLGSGAPLNQTHAGHDGDMPTLYAGADGTARATFRTDNFTMDQLLDADGSAVMVHAGRDNLANIPADPARYRRAPFGVADVGPDAATLNTGDSGPRQRCGLAENGPRSVERAGYWTVAGDGGVFSAGAAPFLGSAAGAPLNAPMVGMAASPSGAGYRLVAADGGVFAYGDAGFHGSTGGTRLNRAVVGMAAPRGQVSTVLRDTLGRPAGTVAFTQEGAKVRVEVQAEGLADGWHGFHVHAVGSCAVTDPATPFATAGGHLGGGPPLGQSHGGHDGDMPVLYSGGGVARATFRTDSFTVAQLLDADGSAVVVHANADNLANIANDAARYRKAPFGPADVGPDAVTLQTGDSGARQRCGVVQRTGDGYWLVAGDGGVFAFGDARFHGSTGGVPLNQAVTGMAVTPSGQGYWLVAGDGGVFAFGDAGFFGSASGNDLPVPVVGMAPTPTGRGYWLATESGDVIPYGDAAFYGSLSGFNSHAPVVAIASSPTGGGYYLFGLGYLEAYTFGDADLFGCACDVVALNQPMRGAAVLQS